MKTFLLEIITPYGKYLTKEIEYLSLSSSKGMLGILPNHSPLISDVLICEIIIRYSGVEESFACSGGLIKINKEKVVLLLNSIEKASEIDIDRANESKKRALERLSRAHKDEMIDIARAEVALKRAINRIKIYSK